MRCVGGSSNHRIVQEGTPRCFLRETFVTKERPRRSQRFPKSIADLMLYYVECGVEFTNLYGDIDERFYSSLESMFADFVNLLNSMENDAFYRRQAKRIQAVFADTRSIGWGFADEMARIYFDICFLT